MALVAGSTLVTVQVPPAGFVVVSTSPVVSTATHSETDGHDTPVRFPSVLSCSRFQADAPPVGSVVVSSVPSPPTATHSEVEGHDTALS